MDDRAPEGVTWSLARFATQLAFEDVSPGLHALIRRQIVDTIGVAVAGSASDIGRAASRMYEWSEGPGTATVWGTEHRTSAAGAALINGAAAHALDFDDTWVFGSHPSAPVVPAAIAMAESRSCPGRELIAALAVGYEVFARLDGSISARRGWHPTAVFGTFGATAAAGRILGLDIDEMTSALGIAASMTGGVDGQEGTMTKALHAGLAARSGVEAATLAATGYTADRRTFDGPYGFFPAYFRGVDPVDWVLVAGLGKTFIVEEQGIGMKMHPAGFYMHQAFEAALDIVQTSDLHPDDVDSVEIAIPVGSRFDRPSIASGREGKFSVQYVVALAILDGALTTESFETERATAPDVQGLLGRIRTRIDPSLPRNVDIRHNPVTITLTDGQSWTRTQAVPSSHWRAKVDDAAVSEKLKRNLGGHPTLDAGRILGEVERLDDASSVDGLMAAVVGGGSR